MLIIDSSAAMARALDQPMDPDLKRLLAARRDQLMDDTCGEYDLGELIRLVVAAPADSVKAMEAAAGHPVVTDPAFEWVADHGGWFEAVTILSDNGFGAALFVPDKEGVDPVLLQLLRDQAAASASIAPARDDAERTPVP